MEFGSMILCLGSLSMPKSGVWHHGHYDASAISSAI
jgi:hypothetical protein